MQLQTFKAATIAQALAQVKSALGREAVILHTRSYQRRLWLGLRRQEVVEITAGKNLPLPPRARETHSLREPLAASHCAAPTHPAHQAYTNHKSRRPHAPSPGARPPASWAETASPGQHLLNTPAASSVMMRSISEEMGTIKTLVSDLMREVRHDRAPSVPQEVFDYYLRLTAGLVAEDLAAEAVKALFRTLRPEHLTNAPFVREKLAEQIEKMIPVSGPITRTKARGPHIVALIGPTGVGKTTTIAKLAANLKLREHRKVGLITIDTYRIAAIDQLKRYADIIGAPLRVVASPQDQGDAIASMEDCEFILIDTAGRSPNDSLKLGELKNFLAQAEPDEVHLVLSGTAGQASVELAMNRFSDVRADKVIFTKLDEAAGLGMLLNVLRKLNKPLSYVTTGQDVPDDIEVGHGRRLAELILGKG